MKTTLLSVSAVLLTLTATFSTPANAGNYVTKAKVERAGGYNFSLKDGSVARILDIRPPSTKYKSCRVDIPSLKTLTQKAQDRKQYGHVPIRLKARLDTIGNFFCLGEGNGCVVIVMVPHPQG